MTQTVNIGTAPNAGNGDPLRVAFQSINAKHQAIDLAQSEQDIRVSVRLAQQDLAIQQGLNGLGILLVARGAWAPSTAYAAAPRREWVTSGGTAYVATTSHISGTDFAADLAAGKWLAVDVAQLIADLAGPGGAAAVGYDGGTVQDVLDTAKPMQSYAALGAYTGRATVVRFTTPELHGFAYRDDADTTTPANGGTMWRDGLGRLWKRFFDGAVNVKWFGAIGGANDTVAIQTAIYSGNRVIDFGELDGAYTITAPLVMLPGQTLKGNLPTLRAIATMDSLIVGANNCVVSGLVLDCNNSQGTNNVSLSGAHTGIDLSDTVGSQVIFNRFKKYRHGIRLYATGTTVSGKAIIYGNEFDAGYEWSSTKPDNFQLGIYAGSTLSAASTNILNFDALRPETAYCSQIVIVGNRFNRGQYGLALHRASNCTVSGNNFARMSRAVSLQQQSTDINVTGNSFTELLTTGVHMAYGTRGVAVAGNSFNGTMANDNSFIQAYYGVSDITITGNKFDSKFGDYNGGGYGLTDTRRPGNGVRIGQQAENITVANNAFRGLFAAIRVQSTIYPTTITPADVNYYNTGFRKIKITGNTIIGDYYVPVATGYKLQMTNTQTYGVQLFVSSGWEDNTLGGWDVEDVLISGNTADGVAFGYVIEQAAMTAASPVAFRDRSVKLTDNNTRNITSQEYIVAGVANTQAPMLLRNSWNPSVTWGSAAPTVGTHKRGDVVYSTAPSASGNIGWVCTTAGTPGAWKTFGAIAA